MFVCVGVWHMCSCAYIVVSVGYQLSCSVTFHLIQLKQALSLNLNWAGD